jgi:ElaB/YqjD/DUF883 family membrane-anchored ribosome-binding protein
MGEQTTAIRPPDQVSREIESTRRRIEQRADALRDRMSPRELLRPVTDRLKDTLGEGGEKVLDVFRENPLPLTLVGVGLGWLLLKDTRWAAPREPRFRAADVAGGAKEAAHHVGEMASNAASAVSEKISSVSEKVGGMSEKVGGMAQRASQAAKKGATSTADWFTTTLEQNPLALAIGTLALGMVAGILIPASEKEEETVGKLGEKAAEAALEKTSEAVQPTQADAPSPEPQQAAAPQEGRVGSEGVEEGMGQ